MEIKISNGRSSGCTTIPNEILYNQKLSMEAKAACAILFSLGADREDIEIDMETLRWYGVEKRHLDELVKAIKLDIQYREWK